jgi:hypothetical protein
VRGPYDSGAYIPHPRAVHWEQGTRAALRCTALCEPFPPSQYAYLTHQTLSIPPPGLLMKLLPGDCVKEELPSCTPLPNPILYLGLTLCSCEAYGVRPATYTEKTVCFAICSLQAPCETRVVRMMTSQGPAPTPGTSPLPPAGNWPWCPAPSWRPCPWVMYPTRVACRTCSRTTGRHRVARAVVAVVGVGVGAVAWGLWEVRCCRGCCPLSNRSPPTLAAGPP